MINQTCTLYIYIYTYIYYTIACNTTQDWETMDAMIRHDSWQAKVILEEIWPKIQVEQSVDACIHVCMFGSPQELILMFLDDNTVKKLRDCEEFSVIMIMMHAYMYGTCTSFQFEQECPLYAESCSELVVRMINHDTHTLICQLSFNPQHMIDQLFQVLGWAL